MVIYTIQTKRGIYITDDLTADRWHTSELADLLYDSAPPRRTFHGSWFFLPEIPQAVTRTVKQPNINHRYELIDPSMESDRVPAVLVRDDIAMYRDYEWIWCDDHKHLQSLYQLVSDAQEPTTETVSATFEVILELDEIVEFNGFSYPAANNRWQDKKVGTVTQDNVQYQIFDKILFPPIVLPMRPCKLSSADAYKIVRQFIKSHISPAAAEITSDYDFCFAVAKRVQLRDPYTAKREILNARGKSYKNRRYREWYVKERTVPVFEMTYSPENYRGYTPIREFQGEDLDDLKSQIDAYCQELIEAINTPLRDCPHCNGMGVIEQKEETNAPSN